MQVERMPTEKERKVFEEMFNEKCDSVFEKAMEYNEEIMKERLAELETKSVHVFKASAVNLKLAALREQYPNATRKQLRQLMRGK